MAFSSSHMAMFNLHHLQFVSHEDQLPHGRFFLLFISADIFRISPGGNETLFEMERNLFSFLKNIKNTPKVFCFSSDKPTRIFPFQAISLIWPPGLLAEMADRRIWRMKAIVRRYLLNQWYLFQPRHNYFIIRIVILFVRLIGITLENTTNSLLYIPGITSLLPFIILR